MNVIVIEDEKPAARRLARMLIEFDIEPMVFLDSVESSVKWLQSNEHPDLIFLDIQLLDGLSFEIFKRVEVKSKIIFTTAYDEYALKAFKLRSVDYLLKPIDKDELKISVEKFQEYTSIVYETDNNINIKRLQQMLSQPVVEYKKRFVVKVGEHIRTVTIEDVECFYSFDKATYLFSSNKQDYCIDYSLEQLSEMLDPNVFFRVSRKYFVNIEHINDIIAYSNSRLKIKLNNYPDQEIIVSREKVKEFKEWLG